MKKFINASLPTSSNALKKVEILFDEKILKVANDTIETEEPVEEIDLSGKVVLPGAIDAHSHILGKSKEHGVQIEAFTRKALEGGWTSLAEMSYHSDAPVYNLDDIAAFEALVNKHSYVDMALWGNVDIADYPYHAEAAQMLWAKGVVGISLFSPSPSKHLDEMSFTEIMDLFMDIYESDTSFAFQGYDKEQSQDYSFEAQRDAIKKLLRRMQENPIHIPRVSSWETVEFINSVSKRSDISFSISLEDLIRFFDGDEYDECDYVEHSTEFMELLKTNKIYMLSNNLSAQYKGQEKVFAGTGADLAAGSYLWVLSELWKARKIPLATCLKMVSENPAKRLGIYPAKGSLDAGSDADFVIYDPSQKTNIELVGKQRELSGAINEVWIRGKRLNADDAPLGGAFLPRQTNPKRRYNKTTWI